VSGPMILLFVVQILGGLFWVVVGWTPAPTTTEAMPPQGSVATAPRPYRTDWVALDTLMREYP
jgi:hypothetical protein